MSVFRRRPAEGGTEPETAAVPVSRDPDLAMPAYRPAPGQAPKDSFMSMPPKPTAPMGAQPGMAPGAPAGAQMGGAQMGGAQMGGAQMGGAQMGMAPGGMPGRPGRAPQSDRRTLVVGKGISLQGTVADAERLVVEGTVESQMIQAQELQITHSGVFKGEVQVDDAEIAGVFDGTLTARGSLVIRATGRVLGVARTRRLSVEDGGQLSGRMEMLTEGNNGGPPGAPAPAYQAPERD